MVNSRRCNLESGIVVLVILSDEVGVSQCIIPTLPIKSNNYNTGLIITIHFED
jgi:hypothetical protein